MTTRIRSHAAMFVACMTAWVLLGSARAEVPLITGEQWTTSSEQLKKAYLVGVANVMDLETAYEGMNSPSDAQSVIPRFEKGLKGQTLDSVRETVDKWYAAHPDQLKRPVIETIWFELVVPGLQRNK